MPRYPLPDQLVPDAHQGYRDRLQRLERRQPSSGVAATHPRPAGQMIIPGAALNGLSAVRTGITNSMWYTPFVVGTALATTGIKLDVSSSHASNVACAVYQSDDSLVPGALAHDYGAVSVSSTGVKTITSAKTYAPGVYLARVHFSGTPNVRSLSGAIQTGTVMAAAGSSFWTFTSGFEVTAAYSATAEDPGTPWTGRFGAGSGWSWIYAFTY